MVRDHAMTTESLSCIHDLFTRRAIHSYATVAVQCGDQQVTYGDLVTHVYHVAAHLRSKGLTPEMAVGIAIEHSIEAVVGVLGILQAGGAYVALSLAQPVRRLEAIIAAAGIRMILVTSDLLQRAPRVTAVYICIDRVIGSAKAGVEVCPSEDVHLDCTAFIRFTSGSTGPPKGVINTHRALVSRLSSLPLPDMRGDDVCAVRSGYGSRMLYPLALGSKLVVLRAHESSDAIQLVRALAKYQVTSLYIIPSLLREVFAVDRGLVRQLR
jgi:non-ribosomal peptide synthetase component F